MERENKKVKKISPAYLRNLALWYVERFGGTRARVERTLMRRVYAAAQAHGPTPQAEAWVQETLDALVGQGLINDGEFARSRVAKGLRMGKPRRLIAQDMVRAGVPSAIADAALAEEFSRDKNSGQDDDMDETDRELMAACTYVAKRRLGHWRENPAAFFDKDLAALARRGFDYQTARRALNTRPGSG